jgi:hypothetical protein
MLISVARSDSILLSVSLNDDIPHIRASHDTSGFHWIGLCGLHPSAAWLQLVEGDMLPVVGD